MLKSRRRAIIEYERQTWTSLVGMRTFGFIVLLTISAGVFGEKYDELYGFALGDPITTVVDELGDPDRRIDLRDGSKVLVYIAKRHYVAFVTLPPDNDFVYSIQLTGDASSSARSLAGVRLGDPFAKVVDTFGEPTSSRAATDQATGEPVAETNIHFYGENFSFEEKRGLVSSIKIKFDETMSSDDPADEKLMATQPEEIRKIRDYILNEDYPELFEDKSYRAAIRDMRPIDFGKDGSTEIVVHFKPHYLQSPTIVIYQIDEHGEVRRIREGLAPGPLVERGADFLDSHELGAAVDFTTSGKSLSAAERRQLIKKATDNSGFGMIVQYRDFFHADSRNGSPSYIDMTHVEPFSTDKDCANFEFSEVERISVGYRKGESDIGVIAALVGDEIYVYEIRSISDDGFLDKHLTIRQR